MSNLFDSNNSGDKKANGVDRTRRNVDRTSGVSRTGNVDRTGSVDRTVKADRASDIDRTSYIDRTCSESKSAAVDSGNAAERDFFPELKQPIEDIIGLEAQGESEQAPQQEDCIDLFSGNQTDSALVENELESEAPFAELTFNPDNELEDIYSASASIGADNLFSADSADEIENLSSSTPRDASIIDKLEGGKNAKRKKPRTKAQRILATVGKVALSAFFIMIIVGCIITVAFMVYVFGFVDDSIDDLKLDQLTLNYTTKIYVEDQSFEPERDKDGNIVGDSVKWIEYQDLCYENRTWVNLNSISQNVIDAYVAGEDERFYTHSGVDFKRTFLSFVNMFVDIYGSRQGGSTITQQLIKNLSGDDEQSPIRKIREIMRARNLEQEFHKDTIMECYLNVIYLGNNAYGIEAAAEYYFGKTANDLSIAEAACIASITKSPAGYDPIKNPDANKRRREWIINNMYEVKGADGEPLITKQERDAALKEELNFVAGKKADSETESESDGEVYSYFTDAIIEQVVQDLMNKKGYSKDGAENVLYRSGLKIYATMDTKIQSVVDSVFCNEENFAQIYGIEDKAQAAITVMDYSGHVVASYGGRGVKTGRRELNRAAQSKRQTGSSMKPLGVYAPALDANLITWSTKIDNSALKVGGINFHNYDRSTSGPVITQNALARSLNLVPLRIVQSLGVQKSYDFLTQKVGLTTLVPEGERNDMGISQLALGALTYGAYTDEMTAAFAIFGNGGVYHAPTYYSVVTSYDGKETILEYDATGNQAISPETANIMNRMLNTVVTGAGGTGGSANFDGWGNYMFAKTGTTSDNKDRTFAGGTPYYCAYVWFGCDIPKEMNRLSTGSNPALLLWKPVMKEIHKDLEKTNFPSSSGVTAATYCIESGKIAGEGCSKTATGYYKKDYMPKCNGEGHEQPPQSSLTPSSSGASSNSTSSGEASSGAASSGQVSSETSSNDSSSQASHAPSSQSAA